MGDILGGFIRSLASFVVAVAALETGSPYAQMGSSRAKTFGAIAEPVVLFVVFTVALVTGTDLPYALAATGHSSDRSRSGSSRSRTGSRSRPLSWRRRCH
jgi:formate hydrogenlyase subunit 4